MFLVLRLSLLSLSSLLLQMFLLLLVFLITPRGDSVHVRIPKVSALDIGGPILKVRYIFSPIRICGFDIYRLSIIGTSIWTAGIFKKSLGARKRGGIGFSYRPARLHRLAEFITWNRFLGLHKRLKIRAQLWTIKSLFHVSYFWSNTCFKGRLYWLDFFRQCANGKITASPTILMISIIMYIDGSYTYCSMIFPRRESSILLFSFINIIAQLS
jgi:hypothetical protein